MASRDGTQTIPNVKHGLSTLKRAMRDLSDRAIDGRTSVAKALGQWKNELIADLGGREAVSTQQLAIVDLALKTKLILDSIDGWLLAQPSLVDKRKRALLPAVRERQALADALARYLGQLGLDRRKVPALDLGAYLLGRYGGDTRIHTADNGAGELKTDEPLVAPGNRGDDEAGE
jgi:hypothetical protein